LKSGNVELSTLKSNHNTGIDETKFRRESSSIQSNSKLDRFACKAWSEERSAKRRRYLNIRPLKDFAISELSPTSPLREILLREEDELPVSTYVDRLSVWLFLIKWRQK